MTGNREETTAAEKSKRWVVPALLGTLIAVPVLILIFSNLDSSSIAWAGWEWEAPRWIVLGATFLAGAASSPVFAWAWRRWRRRRRAA